MKSLLSSTLLRGSITSVYLPNFLIVGLLSTALFLGGAFKQEAFGFEEDFSTWCENWGIECPPGPAPAFPEAGKELTVEQWEALSRIVNGFVQSRSRFAMTRSEFEDEELKNIMKALNSLDALEKMTEFLDLFGLESLEKSSLGYVRLNFEDAGRYPAPVGFDLGFDSNITVRFNRAGIIDFRGLRIGELGADLEAMQSVSVAGQNTVDLTTDARKVTNLHMAFVAQHLLAGIDGILPGTNPDGTKLLSVVVPLVEWFEDRRRALYLKKDFFELVAKESRAFGDASETERTGIGKLLDVLDTVRTGSNSSRGGSLLSVTLSKKFNCVIEKEGDPTIKLALSTRFGLKNIQRRSEDVTRITLRGVRVSAKGVGFDLKTIDVEPDKIVIRGVPLIGKVEIPMDEEEENAGNEAPTVTTCDAS